MLGNISNICFDSPKFVETWFWIELVQEKNLLAHWLHSVSCKDEHDQKVFVWLSRESLFECPHDSGYSLESANVVHDVKLLIAADVGDPVTFQDGSYGVAVPLTQWVAVFVFEVVHCLFYFATFIQPDRVEYGLGVVNRNLYVWNEKRLFLLFSHRQRNRHG